MTTIQALSAWPTPGAGFAHTKIQPPRSSHRARLIARPALEQRLAQALATQALVLVSAPAGLGKTAALTRQIEQLPTGTALAWVAAGEDDDLARLAVALQPAVQDIAEQVVQAQRQFVGVQRGHEPAAAFHLFQQACGVGQAADMGTAAGGELGQQRAAQQDPAQIGRHVVQHLAGQVVEQVALRQLGVGPLRRAGVQRMCRQAQAPPGGPAIGLLVRDSAEDWARSVRHGVKPDGRPLCTMPSEDDAGWTDADMGALVAHMRQLPPVVLGG